MLIGSLSATFVALLPATLSLFITGERWVFCGSSIIALTVIRSRGISYCPLLTTQYRRPEVQALLFGWGRGRDGGM